MIVSGEEVARFVSESLGMAFCPPYSTMGTERGGKIVNGVLFNHFEGADIHVSIAGRGWGKGFIREVGRYVFEQLDCERMTVVTEQPKICEIAKRLGGEVEGRLRNHFGYGRDGVVIGILRSDFRFANFARN